MSPRRPNSIMVSRCDNLSRLSTLFASVRADHAIFRLLPVSLSSRLWFYNDAAWGMVKSPKRELQTEGIKLLQGTLRDTTTTLHVFAVHPTRADLVCFIFSRLCTICRLGLILYTDSSLATFHTSRIIARPPSPILASTDPLLHLQPKTSTRSA